MGRDAKIPNALKRSEVHRKGKREKAQAKLKRRMATRKAEKEKGAGKERKQERLAKNVPRTLDNTRIYDSSSYLTADPRTSQATVRRPVELPATDEASAIEDDEEQNDEDMPEAGPSILKRPTASVDGNASDAEDEDVDLSEDEDEEEAKEDGKELEGHDQCAADSLQPPPTLQPPPRIMITTSPSICKETYAFCDSLKSIFPGGEFFKRPKGRGFELGRVARWAAKRGYAALLVVNEDHKTPNAITVINLPAGPTAYFKLTSVQLGSQLRGHAKPSPHSPELILNNFTTLLGNSVGRLFGSLFPPQPQFRGRQVVTLHNQRDFLFFRKHRYMFASANSAKLQEIGPRFTLKLRWLRKGLPAVVAPDGSVPRGGDPEDINDGEVADEERKDEDEALREMNDGSGAVSAGEKPKLGIPSLDDQQEYEWKWRPKMEVSRRSFFL